MNLHHPQLVKLLQLAYSAEKAAAFRGLLTARGTVEAFVAGLFTGLLPCGLLYGMLAYAASRHDLLEGLAAMTAFGLGTVPAMVAAGLGGSLLGMASRRRPTCASGNNNGTTHTSPSLP